MTTSGPFYVYEHWRLDRDECFYVGKGKGARAYNMKHRNPHHRAIQAKLNREGSAIEIRIVANGLDEQTAFSLECERIAFWRSTGVDLTNVTNGGEGISGLIMSSEARMKMRMAKLGKKQTPEQIAKRIAPLRGRKQPIEAIKKMAQTRTGKPLSEAHKKRLSESHKGKVTSDAAKKSLSLANKGKPWSQKRRDAHDRMFPKTETMK